MFRKSCKQHWKKIYKNCRNVSVNIYRHVDSIYSFYNSDSQFETFLTLMVLTIDPELCSVVFATQKIFPFFVLRALSIV